MTAIKDNCKAEEDIQLNKVTQKATIFERRAVTVERAEKNF